MQKSPKKRRVVLLTQWFDPEPTFKGIIFARELIKRGFDVEVITGFPNYPGGKVYPGYRIRLLQRELLGGVIITRLPLYPNHDQSICKRILNYISFSASVLFYGLFLMNKANVIYVYQPPLTVAIAAILIKAFRRIPVVCDIQDLWPDTLRATGMIKSSLALNFIGKVCNWVYRRVNHIVVLSPGFRQKLIERGVPENKIDVIYNWADEDSLINSEALLPEGFPGDETFKIIFAGNMGKAQALDAVLEAAALLKAANSHVTFLMIGGGVEVLRLQNKAEMMKLSNVIFFPPIPMTQIGKYLLSADALLVHLKKDPLFSITIPSKTQAYMCVGKPTIMAVDGDASELIRLSNGGVISEPANPEKLTQAVINLANLDRLRLAKMGENAQQYYRKHLSLEVGVSRFSEIFRKF